MTATTRQSLNDLSFSELADVLASHGVNPTHTKSLWRALYRTPQSLDWQNAHLPPIQRFLQNHCSSPEHPYFIDTLEVVDEFHSSDGLTDKFLLKLNDGQVIETVLMGYDGRHTVCVSTQAGCAMGCVFCATGQMGFVRHLRPGEIIAQVVHARNALIAKFPQKRLRNLVMMGMGEPLHNFDSVIHALNTISDVRGLSIGPSKIAISTVGVVPAILKLAHANSPYRLAVSLHGSTEAERSALVPASQKWNLASLIDACKQYSDLTQNRIFFEWTLIDGKNDSPETAHRLAELLSGINAHINIIPLNPTNGYDGSASKTGIQFQKILRSAGFPCTFRQRRGIDVAAGCGMLKAARIKKSTTP